MITYLPLSYFLNYHLHSNPLSTNPFLRGILEVIIIKNNDRNPKINRKIQIPPQIKTIYKFELAFSKTL